MISAVIPIFNERENISSLHAELLRSLRKTGSPFEIIIVDDGSNDGSADVLARLSPVTVVSLRKNFGQTAALDAGIKITKGDIIVTLDGDGQNDPADIPVLLAKLAEGYDVVSGWRHQRQDPFMKRFISRGAELLRRFFVNDGIHDSGCTLKAYRRECFENMDLYGEMHRFIPGMLRWQGFTVAEIEVHHRPRRAGKSKYTLSRTFRGFLDMLSIWFWRKFSDRPLHLFGGVGLFLSAVGVALVGVLFVLRLFGIIALAGSVWPLAGFFLVLTGLTLFSTGLLADIVVKSYYRVHAARPYSIRAINRR